MKILYILSLGHSGSTLVDSLLGTHPDILSSGELQYLSWQLERTQDTKGAIAAGTCCSCGEDFRNCEFWSCVFNNIMQYTGANIVEDPSSFDISHFGHFSYANQGEHSRGFQTRMHGFLVREWLELGLPLGAIAWMTPSINRRIRNNWLLYQAMSEVSRKNIIVDSSKNLLIALLLQCSFPRHVWLVFLRRGVHGLVYSAKKNATKRGKQFSLNNTLCEARSFEERIQKYKNNLPGLQYMEFAYEEIVESPSTFLERVVTELGVSSEYPRQEDHNFYIDPTCQHLVAGNPMRYRGRQKVRLDSDWKNGLSGDEIDEIQRRCG